MLDCVLGQHPRSSLHLPDIHRSQLSRTCRAALLYGQPHTATLHLSCYVVLFGGAGRSRGHVPCRGTRGFRAQCPVQDTWGAVLWALKGVAVPGLPCTLLGRRTSGWWLQAKRGVFGLAPKAHGETLPLFAFGCVGVPTDLPPFPCRWGNFGSLKFPIICVGGYLKYPPPSLALCQPPPPPLHPLCRALPPHESLPAGNHAGNAWCLYLIKDVERLGHSQHFLDAAVYAG